MPFIIYCFSLRDDDRHNGHTAPVVADVLSFIVIIVYPYSSHTHTHTDHTTAELWKLNGTRTVL